MLTKKKLPILLAIICLIELSIYFWSVWTSILDSDNFFAITPDFIFDKCARLAGRISTFLFLMILLMVGYSGLKSIYSNENKKESFLILTIIFTFNHLIHLLFVFLRFKSHGKLISINEPIAIGGTIHGILTFTAIVILPIILWHSKQLSKYLYFAIILHLLNSSCFIIKTFLSKVKLPSNPAYHNQFGIAIISVVSFYILYRVYVENKKTLLINQ